MVVRFVRVYISLGGFTIVINQNQKYFISFRHKIRRYMSMAPMPSWRVRPGKLLSRDMPKKDESPAEERGLLKKLPSRIPINLPFSDRLQEVQAQALDDIGDTTRRLVEHDKKEG
jgi:hypothetical protein